MHGNYNLVSEPFICCEFPEGLKPLTRPLSKEMVYDNPPELVGPPFGCEAAEDDIWWLAGA